MSEFENQPHVASYYAATANGHTDYPQLEGEVRADVCVIGGGFSGLSSALALSERGYSVALIEQNKIGWGASGRNGGQMIGGITGEDRMVRDLGPDYADMVWDIGYRGHVGIIVNRVPLLGRIKPNVLYAMGYSGHGVNVSHAAGEIMADAVAGTFERLDVFDKISHFKIPLGQRLCGQLVALGMLYYRMKDLL